MLRAGRPCQNSDARLTPRAAGSLSLRRVSDLRFGTPATRPETVHPTAGEPRVCLPSTRGDALAFRSPRSGSFHRCNSYIDNQGLRTSFQLKLLSLASRFATRGVAANWFPRRVPLPRAGCSRCRRGNRYCRFGTFGSRLGIRCYRQPHIRPSFRQSTPMRRRPVAFGGLRSGRNCVRVGGRTGRCIGPRPLA